MSEYRPQVDTREHLANMIQRSDPQSAEARIRELEDQLAQVRETLEISRVDRDLWLSRIAKAREILTAKIPQSGLGEAITRAVEALEGK